MEFSKFIFPQRKTKLNLLISAFEIFKCIHCRTDATIDKLPFATKQTFPIIYHENFYWKINKRKYTQSFHHVKLMKKTFHHFISQNMKIFINLMKFFWSFYSNFVKWKKHLKRQAGEWHKTDSASLSRRSIKPIVSGKWKVFAQNAFHFLRVAKSQKFKFIAQNKELCV